MTVRVRFAPSPTGHLHIGGARTALYNYLFAKKMQGTLILRIEDTDQERSKKEYEIEQVNDLKWLGIEFNEGPHNPRPEYGPYRQSERLAIYKHWAQYLIENKKAYYCFCAPEDLARKKELATKEGRPPHYDSTCKSLSSEDIAEQFNQGKKPSVRFIAPDQPYVLHDHVRGRVVFPKGMVGDFVILRSNEVPVYNYCCVVDDWLMKITHVIRADDHLSNTCRQLMIYEALNAHPPEFAHVSLLIGTDRQKLSKRHGATSITQYREDHFLPQALTNYLALLGWSHPDERDVFLLEDIFAHFSIDRFNKAPAIFDFTKLKWMNGQHIKNLDTPTILAGVINHLPADSFFHQQSRSWQEKCVTLFKNQIHFYHEMLPLIEQIFNTQIHSTPELQEIFNWPQTAAIQQYLQQKVNELHEQKQMYITEEIYAEWENHLKNELKIKGKALFMGIRGVLTGMAHGPELKFLLPLTPLSVLQKRLLS